VLRQPLDTAELCAFLAGHCKAAGVDTVLFGLAASPFLNTPLTATVLAHHLQYHCEYTFADGYAGGLALSAVDKGALAIMAELAKKQPPTPVTADCLFQVIQGDINAFEVETVIAPEDLRLHRLDFTCLSKSRLLACKALFAVAPQGDLAAMDPGDVGRLALATPGVVRTVPGFYNIQVSAWEQDERLYSPYAGAYSAQFGHHPTEAREKNPHWYMPLERFAALAGEAASLSGEAVLSLSAWGDPLAHPGFCRLLEAALAHRGLSVLVETGGVLVTEELAASAAAAAKAAPPRTNGRAPIYWVVPLVAVTVATYGVLHSIPGGVGGAESPFEQARQAVTLLHTHFPVQVYPQFTRMMENESELEHFYRTWKDWGSLIIQKYDWFCGRLPDRKSADLSPLERLPCWHRLRDMVILLDGTVPLCREQILEAPEESVFSGKRGALAGIWESCGKSSIYSHLEEGCCKDCDEYYTFNF
jgi:spiro-SPASM protein